MKDLDYIDQNSLSLSCSLSFLLKQIHSGLILCGKRTCTAMLFALAMLLLFLPPLLSPPSFPHSADTLSGASATNPHTLAKRWAFLLLASEPPPSPPPSLPSPLPSPRSLISISLNPRSSGFTRISPPFGIRLTFHDITGIVHVRMAGWQDNVQGRQYIARKVGKVSNTAAGLCARA